jgi:hypothetical protein
MLVLRKINIKTCFSLLFSICVLCSNAQIENNILYKEGIIVELTSRNPIPYATIFIPSGFVAPLDFV